MSNTFKKGGIFLISVVSLQVCRVIFSYVNLSDNLSNWIFSFVFQTIFMGAIPFLLYKLWVSRSSKDFFKDIYVKAKVPALAWPLAFVIGILMFIVNIGVSGIWYTVLSNLGFTYVSAPGTIYSSPEVLILDIITSAILPAVFEEITDRGLLLSALDGQSDTFKIVAVGIFFGFLHQNVPQLVPTMLGGFIMAYMAVKGKSIVPGMIVHFLNNFLIILLDYSMQTKGFFSALYDTFFNLVAQLPLIALAVWAGSIALIIMLLRLYKNIHQQKPSSSGAPASVHPAEPVYRYFNEEEAFRKVYFSSSSPNHSVMPAPVEDIQKTEETVQPVFTPQAAAAAKKTLWWEYGMLYCSIIAAAISTIFTYIWGMLR